MTRLLAFDTSTDLMSVALCLGSHTLVHEGEGGAAASARLLPQIRALLARGACELPDLDAIGFGRGPGAFTGLRCACSVAQGLAFGAGKPVLSLDSLLLVADDARAQLGDPDRLDCAVAMDARMDEVYAARYRWGPGGWSVVDAPALTRPEDLAARWAASAPECVAGSGLAVFGARLPTGAARRVEQTRSRAAALARLARAAWGAGASLDPALALPVYVRDKVAQTTAERAAARAAAA